MPTLLITRGYTFRFRTGDCAEQPHVHITGNGGSAKVWLGPAVLARYRGYTEHRIGVILAITLDHEGEWLGRWREVCG